MPRRRLSEAGQRQLMVTQAALTALSQHPSWPDFEAAVTEKQQRIERHFLATLLRKNAPVDQREADYLRGFIHGMNWLVSVPMSAENTLERYLKQQGVTLEGER